ncbi:hypothetical protein CABS02_00898 [Colletotrichum abscissum]|uniref:Myb-like domain-containing protein n=1 Tax=Colletotrichum abscissum TaxID=1671311 RepID=A0A9Q0B9U3_9PEZI|nr:hypothetical protein CABS02_00898 [Colletotrichum abscissum]
MTDIVYNALLSSPSNWTAYTKTFNFEFLLSPTMVKPQFKQLDVESMGKLYEEMERKQKLAQLKRQRERGEQQQPHTLLPPTSPTTLEPDIGILGVTGAQTISYTSGDFHNLPGSNSDFNMFKNLGTTKIAHTTQCLISPSEMDDITTATTRSFSPSNIQPHPKPWSPRTPLPCQPTELASQKEVNLSLEDLPVAPGLVRRTSGQLHPMSSLTSDRSIAVVAGEEMGKSGETRQSCDADGLANDEISSSHDDTYSETCTKELVIPRPKFTVQDSAGIPASQVPSRSHSAMHDPMGSPSSATSSAPSFSIDASAVPLDRVDEPEAEVIALPTPPSDHVSVSLHRGDAIISRGKRGRGVIEDGCKSHDLRSSKRRRSRDAGSGTASRALPARTLRALPSRQRQRPPIVTETTSSLLARSFGKTGLESSNQVPSPPVATAVGLFPFACHTCGFSAEHLLRMSDTVQALAESGIDLSNSQMVLDVLRLFTGFIRDQATKLSHNATSMSKSGSCGVRNQEHTVEAVIGPSNAETVQNDESSDNSDDDSDGASGSESESISSNLSVSPHVLGEKAGVSKRIRWTRLDELRLRAWVQEEKEWSWIAGKLERSEQAVSQHWKIMVKQDKRPGKK